MKRTMAGKVTVTAFLGVILFFGTTSHASSLFDDIADTFSKAGDTLSETTNEVVQSAKEVGEDIGLIEKEKSTQPEAATSKTAQAASPPAIKPAPTMAQLPGGVVSRIKKMNKELAKVEKKLEKGAGTPSDRANRAKLDLNRAKTFMKEIEQRYADAYASGHPDMLAAKDHLAVVQQRWEKALTIATKEAAEAARMAEEKQKIKKAEAAKIAAQKEEERADTAAKAQAAEASCRQWTKRLSQYMGGDKLLGYYPTNDMQLITQWRSIAAEAEATLAEYPQGTCPAADGIAKFLTSKLNDFKGYDTQVKQQAAKTKADMGQLLFSSAPIKGPGHGSSRPTFKAGDHIYGMVQFTKPMSQIYKKKKDFTIRVDVTIDGKKIHAQFVSIKTEAYGNRDYLIFNIAPKPSEMTAYSDKNITYGKSNATTIQGPNEMTQRLGSLGPGSHTVEFSVYYYGKSWAKGGFTLIGSDFSFYTKLHQKIAQGVVADRTLPKAKMQNKKIEEEMIALLKDAGWENVYRLNIVDKDWWIERVDGGNTAVKSRYMAAVALTKKSDGTYVYRKCIFHQDRLLSGGFGKLYLSHQGDEVSIDTKNIDK